ncbi:MAG: hypothetical protein WKG07_32620 [Hymenobacter sp.]
MSAQAQRSLQSDVFRLSAIQGRRNLEAKWEQARQIRHAQQRSQALPALQVAAGAVTAAAEETKGTAEEALRLAQAHLALTQRVVTWLSDLGADYEALRQALAGRPDQRAAATLTQ